MSDDIRYIVGIDEVGRGPLAGPVVLGFVMVPVEDHDYLFSKIKHLGITDSKKLSAQRRDEIDGHIKGMTSPRFKWCTTRAYQQTIDEKGISDSIYKCIERGLKRLGCCPSQTMVYLDGALRAPSNFLNQETVIKGDLSIPTISLASIIAKVTRDKYMEGISRHHPEYSFHQHKGYGTLEHRNAIRKHGLCSLHRKSFCKNFV